MPRPRPCPALTSSQASASPGPPRNRVSAYSPRSVDPWSRNLACPRSSDSPKSTGRPARSWLSGSYVPLSRTITVPPPYSPAGMTPSNSSYSSGWSSVGTARRWSLGSADGPFGTDQDFRTSSTWSRKSRCRVPASWICTTNRGAPPVACARPSGSPDLDIPFRAVGPQPVDVSHLGTPSVPPRPPGVPGLLSQNSSWTAGSPPVRRGSRSARACICAGLSVNPKTSRFCRCRSASADLGMGSAPSWVCQRSTT